MASIDVDIFTGIRPTADLTIANYLGAIAPLVKLQNEGHAPLLFVADMHAITDKEPALAQQYINEIVADCLALGVEPAKTTIFVQSAIAPQVLNLTMLLARHITAAELLRVPALKDKLRDENNPEGANALLLLYPVMMAADILLQRAHRVPVGEDQISHLEVARKLARRFNDRYGEIFVEPKPLVQQSLRVLSLVGEGKMSKSQPAGAILLSDSPDEAAKKIKRAETANAGEMTDKLHSFTTLISALATSTELLQIDELVKAHQSGKSVMADLKGLATVIITRFITEFTAKKQAITPDHIKQVLAAGAKVATMNADHTLELVNQALYRHDGQK